MIDQTFEKGNYNAWEKFVNLVLPSTNIKIRRDIIPSIDNILISMLGVNSSISKNTINIKQICDNGILSKLECFISYDIEDFHAPEAPEKAIKQDVDAIKEALTREDMELYSVDINVQEGILEIVYIIPLLSD